ncbi:unnamed protein product [Symbiodinium necroappetens]|uniref:Uncharacterized protein n=1 Tax=Symbiodinium necroappetens TaxID=1628268 RepID=A0A812LXQ2_9DINO|nr:unnamed protein product [Symbiodinium necroappetens]
MLCECSWPWWCTTSVGLQKGVSMLAIFRHHADMLQSPPEAYLFACEVYGGRSSLIGRLRRSTAALRFAKWRARDLSREFQCQEAEPAIRPGERRPEPWLKGCHQRLYAEEAILQLLGQCLGVPRLRPDQLGALVAYYHRTGDVLPNMVEIQEGLLSRKVDGLEMCAPSMMLARLLEVERDSISLPPTETRSALTNLRMFWERLEEGEIKRRCYLWAGFHFAGPGHEVSWLLPGLVECNKEQHQAKELESLAVYRTKHGFKVNVVLPVCGDKDDTHLDVLERVVLQDGGHCYGEARRTVHCSLAVKPQSTYLCRISYSHIVQTSFQIIAIQNSVLAMFWNCFG